MNRRAPPARPDAADAGSRSSEPVSAARRSAGLDDEWTERAQRQAELLREQSARAHRDVEARTRHAASMRASLHSLRPDRRQDSPRS